MKGHARIDRAKFKSVSEIKCFEIVLIVCWFNATRVRHHIDRIFVKSVFVFYNRKELNKEEEERDVRDTRTHKRHTRTKGERGGAK
jgi:hypothetical protein